jgi:hypothetical protein
MAKITFDVAGEVRPVPPELMASPKVVRFIDLLTRKAEMDPLQAREYTEALIEAIVGEIGTRYVKGVRQHLDAISGTRERLRADYKEVARLGKAGAMRNLPARLSPAEFGRLYRNLIEHVEAITSPTDLFGVEPPIPFDIVEAREEALADQPPGGPKPDLRLGRTGDPVWDPARSDAENATGLDELAELQSQGEDGMARLRAVRAADRFRKQFLGRDYKVSVRLTQRTGPGRAQAHGLRSFDPDMAGAGYEMVIERNGVVISPDGVEITGGRFRFLEWKEPEGPQPSGYYETAEGKAKIKADMIKRARVASQIPNCDGWYYESGQPWLDDVFADTIISIRFDPDPSVSILSNWLRSPPHSKAGPL